MEEGDGLRPQVTEAGPTVLEPTKVMGEVRRINAES
jgi:hypothetical protein